MKTADKLAIIKVASQEQSEGRGQKKKYIEDIDDGKENVAKRFKLDRSMKPIESDKRKKLTHRSVQAGGECSVTADDLTSEETSENYWRLLAEKRKAVLDDSFKEIESLKEKVEALKEENKTCKEMLDESKTLVEVLQEIIGGDDGAAEDS
ncbi:PREDICTED: geminin-like [Nicrophorus vespilloides]|uniref:Geminin-like n=1 Tax=Nicrophorus vespilloides TaxID=110193 RepID=A0ABM1MPZ4_NICVS|nr:PREDICTED: geminin-like [Nicrophorus vespilloides]